MEVNKTKYKLELDTLNTANHCATNKNDQKFFENLKWMTTKEAAIYLRVSVGQMRNMVWRGQLVGYKLNNRLRFLKVELDKMMKAPNEWRIHD